jgi:hypothetical protein
MYPPSFLFLNLLTQGTKTKVLGHAAERGGWSVPCGANEFRSNYDNFPWRDMTTGGPGLGADPDYAIDQARNMPMLMNTEDGVVSAAWAKGPAAGGGGVYYDADEHVHFDQVCRNAEAVAITFDPGAGNVNALVEDDFSLVPNIAMNGGADPLTQYRLGSRMIHYGDVKEMICKAAPGPRKKFGNGNIYDSPTFTVSMITPMWIYTEVPNSTVQTLDVQISWGDTGRNVYDVVAEPCQISLVASQ